MLYSKTFFSHHLYAVCSLKFNVAFPFSFEFVGICALISGEFLFQSLLRFDSPLGLKLYG